MRDSSMMSKKEKEANKTSLKYYSVCSWRDPDDVRIFPDELCDVKLFLKLVQNKQEKVPPVISYNLVLKSEVKGERGGVKLSCTTVPITVKSLKEEIEEQHSVPVIQQKLTHRGKVLGDDRTKLDKIGMKSDDTIEVSYTCEAEVQKVKRVLKWLDYMAEYVELQHPLTSTELIQEAELLATMGLNERLLQRLATNYFSPHDNPRVQANKAYFLNNDGIKKLVRLLSYVTEVPWGQEVIHMKLMEPPLLDALRNFATGNEEYVKELVKCDVHRYAVMMLSRVRLIPFGPVEDMMGSAGVKKHNDVLLVDMVSSVVEMMWSLRKYKELFIEMTDYYICAENLVFLSVSSSVTNRHACLAIYLIFLRMVRVDSNFDPGQASLIFLETPTVRKNFGDSPDEIIVIKYLCAVSMAWKCLQNTNNVKPTSPGTVSQMEKTLELMSDFLNTCPRDVIIKMVECHDLRVHNFSAMFSFFFNPRDPSPRDPSSSADITPDLPPKLTSELYISSYKCLIRHFEVIVSQQSLRDELRYKNTDQCIVCFPWGLPHQVKEVAMEMVRYVHNFKPLPVPKLSIIARYRLSRLDVIETNGAS